MRDTDTQADVAHWMDGKIYDWHASQERHQRTRKAFCASRQQCQSVTEHWNENSNWTHWTPKPTTIMTSLILTTTHRARDGTTLLWSICSDRSIILHPWYISNGLPSGVHVYAITITHCPNSQSHTTFALCVNVVAVRELRQPVVYVNRIFRTVEMLAFHSIWWGLATEEYVFKEDRCETCSILPDNINGNETIA